MLTTRDLSPMQKQLLHNLRSDPAFRTLIEMLKGSTDRAPRYRKAQNPDQQFHDWAYLSGYTDGAEAVLSLLTMENEK